MPELEQITFTFKEVVEALVKHHGIHDGIWGMYVKFGIKAANVGESQGDVLPVAMVPILSIGLQKFDDETNISVDAAKVNSVRRPATRANASPGRQKAAQNLASGRRRAQVKRSEPRSEAGR